MQNVDVNALLQGLQALIAGGAQPGVNNGAAATQVINQDRKEIAKRKSWVAVGLIS